MALNVEFKLIVLSVLYLSIFSRMALIFGYQLPGICGCRRLTARGFREILREKAENHLFYPPPCGGTPNNAFLAFRRLAESQKMVFCSSAGRRRPKKEPLYSSAERKKPKNRFFPVPPNGGALKNGFSPFRRAAEGRTRAPLVFRHTAGA
jgi:hypothetical protein